MGGEKSEKLIDLLTRFLGDSLMDGATLKSDEKSTVIMIPRRTENASWNMALGMFEESSLVTIVSTAVEVVRDRLKDARDLVSYINGSSFMTSWVIDEDELTINANSYYVVPSNNFSGLPLVIDDHTKQVDQWLPALHRLNSTNHHPKRIFMASLKQYYSRTGVDLSIEDKEGDDEDTQAT